MGFKKWFKGEINVLKMLICMEDNCFVWEMMEMMKGCVVNYEKMEVYVMDVENMIMCKVIGELIQIFVERSVVLVVICGSMCEVIQVIINVIGQEIIFQEF